MAEPAEFGVARDFYAPVVAAAAQNLQVNPTIAAGDWKRSIDGAALANMDTLPVVTPAGGVDIKFALSITELSGKILRIIGIDVAGTEWEDNTFTLETYGHKDSQHPHMNRVIGKTTITAIEQKDFALDGTTLLVTWDKTTPGGVITWTPTYA